MYRLLRPLIGLAALLVAGCGAYVPPAPTRSPVEQRQTDRAIVGLPTLEALPSSPSASGAQPTPLPVDDVLNLAPDDPRALGDVNAPVVLIEFTDYE